MCGFCLGAAARRVPVVTDGFIATAAAALASPESVPRQPGILFASHCSAEPGHAHFLAVMRSRALCLIWVCVSAKELAQLWR